MKILHVMAGAEHGGAETFFEDSLVALHEAGISQSVVTRANNPHKISLIEKLDIPLKTVSFNKLWRYPTQRAIRQAAEDFKPDIIQYWMGRAGTFGIRTDAVNLAWYGGYYKPERFKHADFHVGVTEDITKHIVEKGVSEQNAFTLYTYAEFEDAAPVERALFDTPNDAPLFLALSRLHWKKGLDVLLHAFAKVEGAYLWIAGSGPLEKELKELCAQLKLEDRVRFLGWQTDRGGLLAASDFCVFPSRYEPFGTVTVEAWGCNTPLIAAKSQGPNAFITHEHDGLLVEIDDIDGLAEAMNTVIKDPALAARLKEHGQKVYQEKFSKTAFQKRATAFYERIMRLK